jgi:hypothetical protein
MSRIVGEQGKRTGFDFFPFGNNLPELASRSVSNQSAWLWPKKFRGCTETICSSRTLRWWLSALCVLAVVGQGNLTHAQANTNDTLVLQSGKRVEGKILEIHEEKGIKIRLPSGEERLYVPWQVKQIIRGKGGSDTTPPPKPDTPSEPPPAVPEVRDTTETPPNSDDKTPSSKRKTEEPAGPWKHDGVQVGFGLELGFAKSKSFSPWLAGHVAIDVGFDSPIYLRFEPTVGYFQRSLQLRKVPVSIDTRPTDVEVVLQDIPNQVSSLAFFMRALVGIDFSPQVSTRLGPILGMTANSLSQGVCESKQSNSLLFGGSWQAANVRMGTAKQFEIGIGLDFLIHKIPKCDRASPEGLFTPEANAITTFPNYISESEAQVFLLSLRGSWLAW